MNKRRNWYEQKVDNTYKVLHDLMLSSWVQKYWALQATPSLHMLWSLLYTLLLLINSHTCNFFSIVASCAHWVYMFAVFHCLQPTYKVFVLHHSWDGKYSLARSMSINQAFYYVCDWVNYLQDGNTDFNCIYNIDTYHNEPDVLVNNHSIHLM